MGRCLLCFSICGLLILGCYEGSAPISVPSDHSSISDPHAGMPSVAETPESAAVQLLGDAGGPIELVAIILTAPAGWRQAPPGSSFVAAEFALPRGGG